jgi:predicted ArsR family transcriptional regulator
VRLEDLTALSALADPTRRRLYEFVVTAGRPVGREEAAASVAIGRPLAAYHLDRLAESGLLEVEFGRLGGRAGPGAGRPSKLYRRAARSFEVQLPARGDSVLGEIVARAAAACAEARAAAVSAAADVGRSIGAGSRTTSLAVLLRGRGYAPAEEESGIVRLRDCPFRSVAQRHPEAVCALNLALIRGMLSGRGADPESARLEPEFGACCVLITLERTEAAAPA